MRVAIVGTGLIGRILGWRLTELGATVTLIDKNARDHKGTGRVAAAMIAPYTEAVTTEPLVEQLGRHSMSLWQPWLDQLEDKTSQSVYYNVCGTMLVAHAQDEGDWQRFMQHAKARTKSNQLQVLGQTALGAMSPELALSFKTAGYFPNEAVLDNHQLYATLETYFDQQSITWHDGMSVDEINDNGSIEGLEGSFDWIFDCRGNGASQSDESLRSVRGEVIRVVAPEVNIQHAVRLMHPRYPLYIAPKPNHHYVIGATQIESEHDTPVTVRSGLELLSALYSLHKGFSEAQIISLDVGLRPAYPDNLPRIIQHNKCISINGLYRHGFLFAPALVEDIIALIESKPLRFPQVLHT